jgi:hypothetical protein
MRPESVVRFPTQGQENSWKYNFSHILQIARRCFECWVLWVIGILSNPCVNVVCGEFRIITKFAEWIISNGGP